MKKVLLDTNLLIYREDHKIIDEKMLKLTKLLFDSNNFKLVVHPMTLDDFNKMKDLNEKNIILSKINTYKKIENPPKASEAFHDLVGCNKKRSNDLIDNNLLFAVERNCVDYLITNDAKLKKKSININLELRVLTIDEAIELFTPLESKELYTPAFIQKEYLYNIDINDSFFDSLKEDYLNFENWYGKKARKEEMAYISYIKKHLGSFLMLKIEDEFETYFDFAKPFSKKKRMKVSTFKVADTGKKIGETFIKIIINEAKRHNIDEIYITVFDKQNHLIDLLTEYGFKYFTTKKTKSNTGDIFNENVMVKNLIDDSFPNLNIDSQKIFIVPIKQQFHEKLFPESEKELQLSIDDLFGINSYSHAIKKAYICNSNTTKIKQNDILLFYASKNKRSITSIGVVENVFTSFESAKEIYELAKKRTVYSFNEVEKLYSSKTKVILFKHIISLDEHITYDELIKSKILKGPPQGITEISISNYNKLEIK